MRCSVALCLGAALAAGLAGCRHGDKIEVESELRAREEDVRTLREDLDRSEFHNQLLSRELQAVHGIPHPDGTIPKPSEPYPVRSIRLGRQTAGRHGEECPGDDALQVMVEPLDCEGQALKAPGVLSVEALEVNAEGLKRPLAVWEVPPEELRRRWQSGLFTTGYLVTLPWKVWPSTEKLRVIARFRLIDGRVFEADKDITVRLVPAQKRPVLSVPPGIVPGAPVPAMPGVVPSTPVPVVPSTPGIVPNAPAPPVEVLPVPPKEVTPAPKPSAPPDGPMLLRGQKPVGPGVELLRPIPMPPEE